MYGDKRHGALKYNNDIYFANSHIPLNLPYILPWKDNPDKKSLDKIFDPVAILYEYGSLHNNSIYCENVQLSYIMTNRAFIDTDKIEYIFLYMKYKNNIGQNIQTRFILLNTHWNFGNTHYSNNKYNELLFRPISTETRMENNNEFDEKSITLEMNKYLESPNIKYSVTNGYESNYDPICKLIIDKTYNGIDSNFGDDDKTYFLKQLYLSNEGFLYPNNIKIYIEMKINEYSYYCLKEEVISREDSYFYLYKPIDIILEFDNEKQLRSNEDIVINTFIFYSTDILSNYFVTSYSGIVSNLTKIKTNKFTGVINNIDSSYKELSKEDYDKMINNFDNSMYLHNR